MGTERKYELTDSLYQLIKNGTLDADTIVEVFGFDKEEFLHKVEEFNIGEKQQAVAEIELIGDISDELLDSVGKLVDIIRVMEFLELHAETVRDSSTASVLSVLQICLKNIESSLQKCGNELDMFWLRYGDRLTVRD